jgi:transposase
MSSGGSPDSRDSYSLVSTCEALGVNPQAYLADVLMRVQSHPQSRVEELLPHNWLAATF